MVVPYCGNVYVTYTGARVYDADTRLIVETRYSTER